MNRQTLSQILKSPASRKTIFSIAILSAAVNSAFSLSVNAQSYSQDSFLPPEVIPVNHANIYNAPQSSNPVTNAQSISAAQAFQTPQTLQTPQEARQALYHSLMGTNTYPQFNGQANNINANQAPNQNSNSTQNLSQTWTTQTSPQNNSTQTNMFMSQNNVVANAAPAQSQTLTGSVSNQTTSQQRTTGGISHAAGVITGLGFNAFALASMRSPGGIYSAGLLGAGTMNYGLRNGFRF